MARRAQPFTQGDLTRAMKAALAAGLTLEHGGEQERHHRHRPNYGHAEHLRAPRRRT
jgi:hypothetical protein